MFHNVLVLTVLGGAIVTGVARSEEAPADKQPKNVIRDGDFENPSIGASRYRAYSGSLGAWTIEKGSVDIVGKYWKPAQGKQSLDLSGHGPGTIYQDVRTVPMKKYTLRFAAAGNPEPGDHATPKKFKVFWGDREVDSIEISARGRDFVNVGWKQFEYIVVAEGDTTRLKFQSMTETFCGPILDDISLTLQDPKRPRPMNPKGG